VSGEFVSYPILIPTKSSVLFIVKVGSSKCSLFYRLGGCGIAKFEGPCFDDIMQKNCASQVKYFSLLGLLV